MPEIRTNGSYELYPGELYNPAVYGAFGVGGVGAGLQSPWAFGATPISGVQPQQTQQAAWQSQQAIQIAQQIAARQVTQAIQQAQVLQVLQQILQILVSQQPQHAGVFGQPQIGLAGVGVNPLAPMVSQPFSQTPGQPYGPYAQQAISQALHHLATQQQLQNIAAPPMTPFRYGLA